MCEQDEQGEQYEPLSGKKRKNQGEIARM